MKKYSFLLMSVVWIIAAIFNFYDKASVAIVLYNIFVAVAFISLHIFQLIFEKRGERGNLIFKRICISYIVILCIILLFLVTFHLS